LLIFSPFIIILTNIIKASKFLQGKDEKKPAFGQNKVRADIFSGSLAVFQSEKVAFRGAGGREVWGEYRPPREFYRFWAKSVRIFSNRHRQLVFWGEFKRARQPIFPLNIFLPLRAKHAGQKRAFSKSILKVKL